MIVIRPEQLAALEAAARERIASRVVMGIVARSDSEIDGEALRVSLVAAIERAASYGLTSGEDQERFAELAAAHGAGFELRRENAWMLAMLTDREVTTPSLRLRRLLAELRYREETVEHNRRLRRTLS